GLRRRPPSRRNPESRWGPGKQIVQAERFPNLCFRRTAMQMHRADHAGTVHAENCVGDDIPAPLSDPALDCGSLATSDHTVSGFLHGESCTSRFAFAFATWLFQPQRSGSNRWSYEAMIDDSASFGYRLETDLIMIDIDQHEMI